MLDPVAQPVAPGAPRAALERVQRHVDGRVAVGVDAQLPAVVVGIAHHLLDLLGPVVQCAAVAAAQVGLALEAGAALVRAV